MTTAPLSLLALSFVLGLRHALELDHVAAVATLASGRRGVWRSSLVGTLWGVGHATTLLVVAAVVVAFPVRIPVAVARLVELGVAVMLVGLGARLLWSLRRGAVVHSHLHAHGPYVHTHAHAHSGGRRPHVHDVDGPRHSAHGWRRPLLVGSAHGLAGSAGLMMVVLATIPSGALALAYVAIFGLGSIGGMTLLSAIVGLPLAFADERFVRTASALRAGAALASVGVGVAVAWRVAVEAGLWA